MTRYILHIKNTPNNYHYNITDFLGNTFFSFTAKQLKYKSKQVRSTIIIHKIWQQLIIKMQSKNFKHISLNFSGTTYFKREFIIFLRKQGFFLYNFDTKIPFPFNGCKTKHKRRV